MKLPLLRLYPADFRRAFGDEMAEAYREATEDAGPLTRLREAGDIVAHALRLRLGVGSAQRGGRLFAAAAPFALAATGAHAAFLLASTLNRAYVTGRPDFETPLGYAMNGFSVLALIGAVVALSGRFAAGARTTFAAVAGSTVCFVIAVLPGALEMPLENLAYLAPPLAIAALPLLCPPDLHPPCRIRTTTGLVALMIWAPLSVVLLGLLDAGGFGMIVLWRFAVTVTAALALAGRPALSGIRTSGQFALAAAPFLVLGHFAGVVGEDTALPCLVLLASTGLTVRRWRRRHSGPAGHA
ncbi:hypothetical protein Snoj_33710 [Streptomyces nojiriensis]|uniref:Uncharacterized protein n=1 Tax=Streptomyces nojiriensis TaxID=66374 RepID=A0ABQ3SMU4_9ACTN|nr:hypothetical protein [Streptomyces nojiriensis]QTI43018.1 hypothetical protein JYK04_00780 [Streptomyces nojiriensis]GGS30409.1 hypothetical protein GCM10010205_70620 [Streptomyces nojiriensis]GHI69453.1 hypothetical protein Snoj_33710 [Streptomyces nojiriensis]